MSPLGDVVCFLFHPSAKIQRQPALAARTESSKDAAMLRKKRQRLSIQSRESHHGSQAFAARKVEANNLIAGDAIEVSIGSKTQAARSAELSLPIWKENTDEVSVGRIVFPNSCDGAQRAKWTLAGYNEIAIGRDCEIERTQFRICHEPRRLRRSAGSESDYGVIALAVRADSSGEEQLAIATKRKSARKRYDSRRQRYSPAASSLFEKAMIV